MADGFDLTSLTEVLGIGKKTDTKAVAELSVLTAQKAQLKELLIEGHDLVAAVMLRSGVIFSAQHADLTAKVKAWNARLQHAGVITYAKGEAR